MKDRGQATDLLTLCNQLVELIHSHKLQAAAERVSEAERLHIRASAEARGLQIAEITRALSSAKAACMRIRAAVESLPPNERLFAKAQIEEVIEQHFTTEMNELRRRKQQLSKPR